MEISRVLICNILAFIMSAVTARLDKLKTENDYLNICLDGKNQKTAPGPEAGLFKLCSPWSSRSCCAKNVTEKIHTNARFLNFDWDHCRDLSPRCREHFIQDLCFYECSPNMGPWLVKDVRKIRNERFVNVPLCHSVCQNWWNACKEDFTCVDNWAAKFNWSSGINTCPQGASCRPFKEVFQGPKHFCEGLMGGSFEVVPDEDPMGCFYMWFSEKDGNPNKEVARRKIAQLLGKPYRVDRGGDSNDGVKSTQTPALIFGALLTMSTAAVATLYL